MTRNTNSTSPTLSLCLKDTNSDLKARSRSAQSLAQSKETLINLKQKQEEFTSGAQHLNSPPSSGVCAQLFTQPLPDRGLILVPQDIPIW